MAPFWPRTMSEDQKIPTGMGNNEKWDWAKVSALHLV